MVRVRYIVDDVEAAVGFYTGLLDFEVVMHPAPSFAILARQQLQLVLSGTGGPGGGSQAMPDGRVPEPGGWNRIMLEVGDLDAEVARLRAGGATFRNEIVTGRGVRQILLEDPAGNPVELNEPLSREL
jgi:catechol 2,3-dioxygenase-like lactoylglutathione lyase family enzyme